RKHSLNARQKRLFEEALKRNPDLKMPSATATQADWSEADLALVKQGVGDKSSRPATPAAATGDATGEAPTGEQSGAVVTYFEAKGFGVLRPDDGGRDIFFHVARVGEGMGTELRRGR